MIVQDLDGNQYEFKVSKQRSNDREKSALFKQARTLIKKLYPTITVCEEVPITVKRGSTLYLDIYLPMFQIVIEVHGKQHFEYTPHYHQHKHRFGRACLNDQLKKEWCEVNHFIYVELAYNESRDEWEDKIRRAVG